MVGLRYYNQSGATKLLIIRGFHYDRMCFKSVRTLGALHSQLWKRPWPSASALIKAKNVELIKLYHILKAYRFVCIAQWNSVWARGLVRLIDSNIVCEACGFILTNILSIYLEMIAWFMLVTTTFCFGQTNDPIGVAKKHYIKYYARIMTHSICLKML